MFDELNEINSLNFKITCRILLFKTFCLGEDGEEESTKEINETPSAVEKDNDKPLKESVLQSGSQIAQVEENQKIQSPPVLISQISIPLDWIGVWSFQSHQTRPGYFLRPVFPCQKLLWIFYHNIATSARTGKYSIHYYLFDCAI